VGVKTEKVKSRLKLNHPLIFDFLIKCKIFNVIWPISRPGLLFFSPPFFPPPCDRAARKIDAETRHILSVAQCSPNV
jgi:hypothetical protein